MKTKTLFANSLACLVGAFTMTTLGPGCGQPEEPVEVGTRHQALEPPTFFGWTEFVTGRITLPADPGGFPSEGLAAADKKCQKQHDNPMAQMCRAPAKDLTRHQLGPVLGPVWISLEGWPSCYKLMGDIRVEYLDDSPTARGWTWYRDDATGADILEWSSCSTKHPIACCAPKTK